MSKKVELEVRKESAYGKATEFMRQKQIYTKTDLVNFFKGLGRTDEAAVASAVVMLSPRKESNRGDCRGNMSNPWGHIAYNDKLQRKDKEEQKFRFRFRDEVLERLTRKTAKTEQEKEVAVEAVGSVEEVATTEAVVASETSVEETASI